METAFEIRSGAQWAATLFPMLVSVWVMASFVTSLEISARRIAYLAGL
jgi:hypothetical protein